jgi:hypothetical protein
MRNEGTDQRLVTIGRLFDRAGVAYRADGNRLVLKD